MKTVYLLPCSCGNKVRVDAGQAGAKVPCTCGKQLTVPTFRGLRELEVDSSAVEASAAAAEPQSWSAARGALFSAGLLISVIAGALTCYHSYVYWQMRDGGDAYKREYIEGFRHDVEHLTPEQSLYEFQRNITDGLKVDGTPPWGQITAMRDTSYRWLIGALIALAFGLVSLFGSIIVPSQSRRPAS